MSNAKIFSGNQYYFVFKNKQFFENNCTIVCSEITFSTNSFHIETSQLTALQIN